MPTLKMSVSGIRGIIGDGLDVIETVYYTAAFRSLLPNKATVVIATDTRLTRKIMSNTVSSTLMALGVDVIDIGIAPTPTASYMTEKLKASGGIIISASHNPIEWNALKLIGKGGIFLEQPEVDKVAENYKKYKTEGIAFLPALKTGTYTEIDNAIDEHIKRIVRFIDVDKIKKAKLKVACDYVNGTGLLATPKLLKELGVKEVSINNTNTGKFAHSAEPSASNMKDLSKLVKTEKADIGFTQDPDADRLAFVLDDGRIVSEEYTVAVCAKYLWSVGKGDACVNLSTSRMIEDIAKETNNKVHRSKIGEIHVSTMVRKNKLYFGGEGNGGIIVPSVSPCRDSLLGIALILELMASTKKSISEIVNEIPAYSIVKDKVDLSSIDQAKMLKEIKKLFPTATITDIDGVHAGFDDAWVHIRASNTEPIVRIIAEARSVKIANEYIEAVKSILK